MPVNVGDRTDKNIQEGRGFRMFDKARGGRGSGVFEFASSNQESFIKPFRFCSRLVMLITQEELLLRIGFQMKM